MNRGCGILLHISSLPSKWGIGCFDKQAYEFVDFLSSAGCRYWQILGLNPTGYGDSPYTPISVFAGNPYFIDLSVFFTEKELKSYNLDKKKDKKAGIDYTVLYENKTQALLDVYAKDCEKSKLTAFIKENKYWIESYADFMAKKQGHAAEFYIFVQMIFAEQWNALKKYANEKGIEIIGDLPIYPAMDGADVAAWPNQFDFIDGKPTAVAGVPPDYFNEDGQLWGNPLYDWKQMQKDKYKWWCERIKQTVKLYDILRIDHFRAFDTYYKIPYGAKTAKDGVWAKGPGMKVFNALKKAVPDAKFVLEDLGGDSVPSVKKLRDETGFPGMHVFQFGFDGDSDNVHLSHNYPKNSVAYIGTHDNDTFAGFLKSLDYKAKKVVANYLHSGGLGLQDTTRLAVEKILESRANIVILTMQDLLFQGSDSRMNTPGQMWGNWQYRVKEGSFTKELAKYLCMLLERTKRMN